MKQKLYWRKLLSTEVVRIGDFRCRKDEPEFDSDEPEFDTLDLTNIVQLNGALVGRHSVYVGCAAGNHIRHTFYRTTTINKPINSLRVCSGENCTQTS